jgi:hypothetical protein
MLSVGEVTTLARASSNFSSIRTVVPMNIVRQWQLKEGDKLDWTWEARNNEMVVVVRKAGEIDNRGTVGFTMHGGKVKKRR